MPPKSKRIKNIKTSKENIFFATRATQKNVKTPRKALSDKTNSASDDNDPSPTNSKVGIQTRKMARTKIVSTKENKIVKVRPNRNQKLPEKLSENQVLKFINDESKVENQTVFQKKPVVLLEKLQISDKAVETNIADSRPKRIRRLPNKFENHFISPSKCIPVQPIQASTPIVQNKDTKTKLIESSNDRSSVEESSSSYNSSTEKQKRNTRSTKYKLNNATQEKKRVIKNNTGTNKKQADTNNNANDLNQEQRLCNIPSLCNDANKISKNRVINKDYSIRLFDERNDAKKRNANNLDVYEFTYDPAQEPPQKKKRKRIVKKKPDKPKHFFNNNYDKNIAKTLTALKNVLSKKSEPKPQTEPPVIQIEQNKPTDNHNVNEEIKNVSQNASNIEGNGLQQNFNSFNVEDIVLNDVSVANDYNDINYSPVQSPDHVGQQSEPRFDVCTVEGVTNNDPLNIQDDLSFFDDQPVASSSMNVSTRNPSATPWRAEYEQLPIKWQVNTYVKPNMTPALESSFINFDNRKKHVYTNMVPEDNVPLPEIIETEPVSKLKQTSIISFFKEVVERQNNKKSKLKTTPVKVISVEANNPNTSQVLTASESIASNSINKSVTPQKKTSKTPISGTDTVSDKENSTELQDAQTQSPINSKEKKSRQNEKKNKDITFFGFDESEEQENVSPVKKIDKRQINALKPRSRAILQEFNRQNGPTRLRLGAKNKNAKINAVNVEVIETSEQNLFQEKVNETIEETNNTENVIEECNINLSPEDSQSVHLFVDLEVVHHVKPIRKSYGKAKKVAFRQSSESIDAQDVEVPHQNANSSAEEDNLDDLTFEIPSAQTKKQRKKKKVNKQRSKKEDKEAEEWAAGFNSMCEDVDNFDLIVE